jgi:hypothetical protein
MFVSGQTAFVAPVLHPALKDRSRHWYQSVIPANAGIQGQYHYTGFPHLPE